MLRQATIACPDGLWNNANDSAQVWRIVYHALFYTHLYLQDSLQSFTPWAKHRPGYESLSQESGDSLTPAEPYDKATLLEYMDFCQGEVKKRVPKMNLDGPSGFHWLPFSKFELQIYTIRHIQQHTGELMERLGSQANLEFPWVGQRTG